MDFGLLVARLVFGAPEEAAGARPWTLSAGSSGASRASCRPLRHASTGVAGRGDHETVFFS